MALKVETNVKSLPHNICDFCAFLDDDDDFIYLQENGYGVDIVVLCFGDIDNVFV